MKVKLVMKDLDFETGNLTHPEDETLSGFSLDRLLNGAILLMSIIISTVSRGFS